MVYCAWIDFTSQKSRQKSYFLCQPTVFLLVLVSYAYIFSIKPNQCDRVLGCIRFLVFWRVHNVRVSFMFWMWGGGTIVCVYIRCIEYIVHLSCRRRSPCMCLHHTPARGSRAQPCPDTIYTRATHEWTGPWVPRPRSNQRLVNQSLAGRFGQRRAPPPGRQPMGCTQNVGTWIRAHVDARKVPRERASKDKPMNGRAERESWGWTPRCCSSYGLSIDGLVVSKWEIEPLTRLSGSCCFF